MTMTSDERAPGSEIGVAATVTEQPVLELDLPEHLGAKPLGMRVKVRGSGDRISSPTAIGERRWLLVEVRTADAGHKVTKKDGLLYMETAVIDDLFDLGDKGRDLTVALRTEYRDAEDLRRGALRLFGEDRGAITPRILWADESGYVYSDEDMAQIRGELTDDRLAAEEASARESEAAEDARAFAAVQAPRFLAAVADGDSDGFDVLSEDQIVAALGQVDALEVVFACQEYEKSNGGRARVLKALEARADELAGVVK